ncbi:MAG TPA: M1 family aminopeptidase [Flavipsychrobacter sp.]|nr:M1 family aminopeptidase [Flavipsychrobacter sp.]
MRKFFAIGMLWLCVQVDAIGFCSGKDVAKFKRSIAVPQEDDYDVQYVKLDLSATNASTAIWGEATTVAKVVAPSMVDYYFELSSGLTIDSAKVNGQLYPVSSVNSAVRRITLNNALSQNSVFSVAVFYHGAPTGGTGFFTNGILNQTDASVPVQVTHTVSAAIHSRDWFPCKQSLTDKIDSADIWISVPAGLKVASNGVLKNVTAVGVNNNRYEWSTRYPVDYYLLSFSIAPYTEYNYFMQFTNGDSMLVQNYIYDVPSVLQQHQDELDSIEHIINYFSSIFGRYPYDKEKIGICMTPLSGGMENQTMVSLGSLDITLIAHELAHQWWGNSVTCQSLKDMWLNEGWATYCEQLFIEKFWGQNAMLAARTPVFNTAMAALGGSVYVDDTTQESRIYSSRLTYNKGAAVAHMLRYMINDDTLFFQLLRDYHQQYKYKTATTDDLKNLAEQVSNIDLDTFFHQWVYKEGYPTYSGKWAQNGNNIVIRLNQATSKPSSVSVFKIPIEIQLKSAQGDTVVRVLNDHNVQYYSFQWSKQMTGMGIDPQNHILNKVLLFTNDPTILNIESISGNKIEVYPNPTTSSWLVKNLPVKSPLTLTDINGRRVWQQFATADSISISSANLTPGTYMLSVFSNGVTHSYHLIRQ